MHDINEWDIIEFGPYEWIVLEKNANGAMLLLSKDILERRAYHSDRSDMTWAKSDIRKYLNLIFINSFSPEERERIISTHNKTPDNPQYGTDGGNDTYDHIFLLSIEEAEELKLRVGTYKGDAHWWWLRSPGRIGFDGVGVNADGTISVSGRDLWRVDGGIRPAMWLEG